MQPWREELMSMLMSDGYGQFMVSIVNYFAAFDGAITGICSCRT